jgi:maltose phosphorylase
MNGEECHNEWEITFEEIHRNGAIAFAIYNFYRYRRLQLHSWKGLEVLLVLVSGIKERIFRLIKPICNFGVTGPNEYENNVNNNFYTNYIAKWCLEYTFEQIQVSLEYPSDHKELPKK